MVSCFWAAEAKSFESFVAARVFCGLCMAPLEALVPASIADIWYVYSESHWNGVYSSKCQGSFTRGDSVRLFSTSAFLVVSTWPFPLVSLYQLSNNAKTPELKDGSCCHNRVRLLSHCTARNGRSICSNSDHGVFLDARVRVHQESFKY